MVRPRVAATSQLAAARGPKPQGDPSGGRGSQTNRPLRRGHHPGPGRLDEPARPFRNRPAPGRSAHSPAPRGLQNHRDSHAAPGRHAGAARATAAPSKSAASETPPAPAKEADRHQKPHARHFLLPPQPRCRRVRQGRLARRGQDGRLPDRGDEAVHRNPGRVHRRHHRNPGRKCPAGGVRSGVVPGGSA